MFLFGKEHHRRALSLKGELPIGDLYISVAAATENTRTREDCIEFLLNKKEIKTFHDYVRSAYGRDPGEPSKNLSKARESWLMAEIAMPAWFTRARPVAPAKEATSFLTLAQ